MRYLVPALMLLLAVPAATAAPNVNNLAARCDQGDAKACRELAEQAMHAKKPQTRAAAAALVRDPAVLESIARSNETYEVIRAALRNPALGDKAREIGPFVDPEVTRSVQDQDLLTQIVRTKSAGREVRKVALSALRERQAVETIAADDAVEDWLRHLADQHALRFEPDRAAVMLTTSMFGDFSKDAWPVGCTNSQSVHLMTFGRAEGDRPGQPYSGHDGMIGTDTIDEPGIVGRLFVRPDEYESIVGLSTTYNGMHVAAAVKIAFTVRAGRSYCVAGGEISGNRWTPRVVELSGVEKPHHPAVTPVTLLGSREAAARQSQNTAPGTWVVQTEELPEADLSDEAAVDPTRTTKVAGSPSSVAAGSTPGQATQASVDVETLERELLKAMSDTTKVLVVETGDPNISDEDGTMRNVAALPISAILRVKGRRIECKPGTVVVMGPISHTEVLSDAELAEFAAAEVGKLGVLLAKKQKDGVTARFVAMGARSKDKVAFVEGVTRIIGVVEQE